ncbi:MAG: heavy metal-responsive transcriptional regulator [Nitrospira sp.]|nr:heavy metal-responsive transcriptional regulator [Nitrospira sp.]
MTSQRTIGWLAKSAGVHVQTVRYYERQQLLSPVGRRPSGYRVYDHEAVARLRFIRNAKALGFTLREIGELLRLRVNGRARCGDVQRKAEAKLHGVEAKLTDLQALARALRGLIRMCQAGQPIDHCQILRQMEREQPASQQSQKRRTS